MNLSNEDKAGPRWAMTQTGRSTSVRTRNPSPMPKRIHRSPRFEKYLQLRAQNLKLLGLLSEADLDKPTKAPPKGREREFATYGQSFLVLALHQTSLSFGGGAVNQTNVFLFIESMPYGGVGTAGLGNYYGKYGYDSLTHAKSVLISPPDVAIDHLFPPCTKERVQAMDQWFDY